MQFEWLDFWQQADVVGKGVAIVLLGMSIASWAIIFKRVIEYSLLKRNRVKALAAFWQQHDYRQAVKTLDEFSGVDPYQILAKIGRRLLDKDETAAGGDTLASTVSIDDRVTRIIRYGLARSTLRLEKGLAFLGTVGSSAPFIGLFGTVWGILNALRGIAFGGAVQIEKIAGPISEALVMTAFGLGVAIPALLAYNAFVRVNRVLLVDLDGFAHDLHRYFCVLLADKGTSTAERDKS